MRFGCTAMLASKPADGDLRRLARCERSPDRRHSRGNVLTSADRFIAAIVGASLGPMSITKDGTVGTPMPLESTRHPRLNAGHVSGEWRQHSIETVTVRFA
jgi:hypothetical protein